MHPLLDKKAFQAFLNIRQSYSGSQEAANIFVPVGSPPEDTVPRILFIGQATRGMVYDGQLDYDRAGAACEEIRKGYLSKPTTPFWQFVCNVCRQVIRTADLGKPLLEQLDRMAGWSNLAIIGAAEGNPGSELIAVQKGVCVEALRSAIAAHRPVATVLVSGDYCDKEILLPALGERGDWHNNVSDENRVAIKLHPKYGPILWANHPGWSRREGFEQEEAAFISGYISALVRAC